MGDGVSPSMGCEGGVLCGRRGCGRPEARSWRARWDYDWREVGDGQSRMEVAALARPERCARLGQLRLQRSKCGVQHQRASGPDDRDGEEVCESGLVVAVIERIDENEFDGMGGFPDSTRTTRASRRTARMPTRSSRALRWRARMPSRSPRTSRWRTRASGRRTTTLRTAGVSPGRCMRGVQALRRRWLEGVPCRAECDEMSVR